MPPAMLDRNFSLPSSIRISSAFSSPVKRCRGEAGADLDALHRVDAHHRRGEVGIELAVERRAEADRHARRRSLRPPRRRTSRPCASGRAAPPIAAPPPHRGSRSGCARSPPSPSASREALMLPTWISAPRISTGSGSRCASTLRATAPAATRDGGLARGGSPAAAIVAHAVILGPIGEVGVAGAELVLDLAVVLAALILVLDQQRDRRAGGLALEHAGQDLAPRRPRAAGSRSATGRACACRATAGCRSRPSVDARRRAVDHAADRRPVAFAPGRETEQVAEAVVRHRRQPPLRSAKSVSISARSPAASVRIMPTTL